MRGSVRFRSFLLVLAVIVAAGAVCYGLGWVGQSSPPAITPASSGDLPSCAAQARGDTELAELFATEASGIQVFGSGTVVRLLADDEEGSRHQRFILRLDSEQTLLIAHNIDIAPRLDGLAEADQVSFCGEYVHSQQGGTIHWTHHDPGARHPAGWLEWQGQRYG